MAEDDTKKQLYDAAINGDDATLIRLLTNTNRVVGEVSFAGSRNLLHLAAMHGIDAVVTVLEPHTQLARDLDSRNSTALHIAAAHGNVVVASKSLSMAPETLWWRDCHDMNPVHIAAIHGRVDILTTMLGTHLSPAMERVHRGETVLHLCVKHDQFACLQFLVGKLGELVFAKDDDDETILHLAVRFNQLQTVKYLVEDTKIKKKTLNLLGKTALQILTENPHTNHYLEMENLLKISSTKKISKVFPNLTDTTMVVVGLIATMAFQVSVSPPGGVWQEDTTSHKAGDAVMASTHPKLFKQFVRANTVAFISSMITIFLITTRQPSGRIVFLIISLIAMWVSLASISLSYGASIILITPNTETQSLFHMIIIVVAVSLGLFGLIVVYDIIREWYTHRTSNHPIDGQPSERFSNGLNRAISQVGRLVWRSDNSTSVIV